MTPASEARAKSQAERLRRTILECADAIKAPAWTHLEAWAMAKKEIGDDGLQPSEVWRVLMDDDSPYSRRPADGYFVKKETK